MDRKEESRMNRTFSWSIAVIFALAGSPIVYAQSSTALQFPKVKADSKPVANATAGPQIIAIGSPLTFGGNNAPDTYSATTTFSSTPVLVDNGAVKIWQDQVPTGANGEWDIFHLQIANGGPLAKDSGSEWDVILTYTLSAAASFDAVAQQFAVNGTPVGPLTDFGTICCAAASNPILPGWSYYHSGFNGALAAGPQTNWQQIMVRPYSFVSSGGINPSTANEFIFALHFTLGPALPTVNYVISASAFGAFPTFGPGSWIEIYGTDLGVGPQGWTASDFNGVNAPTTLVGTSVTINGQSTFVDYVNDTQVNAQVPAGVNVGSQNLVVTTAAGSSAPFPVNVVADQPGLLAPSSFNIGGTQYAVAQFVDGEYVLPVGAIAGVTSRPAKPGESIVIYGIGFGSVTPTIPPGQMAQGSSTVAAPFTLSFGGTQATVGYDGLSPQSVGVYQFNVVVPSVSSSNKVPLSFSLGGVSGAQKLFIAVDN
jgi:uncharacterized protein (TIGR03437 family)